jgi:hypothetical protein
MRHTSCRATEATGIVDVHLVVPRRPLDVAVRVFLLRVLFSLSVAQALGLAAGGREEVVDGAGQQIAALCRHILEDLLGRRFAIVDGGYLVGSREGLVRHATAAHGSTYARFR